MADTGLRSVVRLPHATAMVIGTIIGASIFVQPSEITSGIPSIGGVLFVWFAAGVLTLIGALVCAELAGVYPQTGGVYVFLREEFGRPVGFLWGWAMFWIMHSGIIAAIAMVFGRYAAYFFPLGDAGIKAVAIAAVVVLSAVNYLGVRHGTTLQTVFTGGKLLAVGLIVLVGFILGAGLPEHFVPSAQASVRAALPDYLTALVAGLFAFGGWHMVTYSAEETVEPHVTIPRALIIGTLVVTLAYIGMNAVYLYVLPFDSVASSTRVAADAADAVLGFGGGATMSGIVMFSTFGALAGIVLAGPRVYYSMARDGMIFGWIGGIHPHFKTPHRAIVLQGLWSSFLVASVPFRDLFTRVIYTEWIFFGLLAVAVLKLRGRRQDQPYRMPGFPVLPGVFVICSFAIVINQLVTNWADAALGLGFVLLGIPVYYLWSAKRSTRVHDRHH